MANQDRPKRQSPVKIEGKMTATKLADWASRDPVVGDPAPHRDKQQEISCFLLLAKALPST